MLRDIEKADEIEKASTLGDGVERVVGEGDDPALPVGMCRALHLEPQGAKATDLGDHDVAVIHVRLDARRKEATLGAREHLRLDHQLDEGSKRGPLEHADRLLDEGRQECGA